MTSLSAALRNRRAPKSKASLAIASLAIFGFMGTAMANDTGDMVRMLVQERGGGWDTAPRQVEAPSLTIRHYSEDSASSSFGEGRSTREHFRRRHAERSRRPAIHVAARPEHDHAAPPASPLEDETLRPGDAVMAQNGLWVFEGSSTFPYRPSDFRALATATSLSSSERKRLAPYNQSPLRSVPLAELDRRDGPIFETAKPKAVAAADEHGLTIYRQR